MNKFLSHLLAPSVLTICAVASGFAADHGDAPFVSGSARTADIGDGFLFLDPDDNDRLVIAMTVQGFIVPGEAVNFSVFDPMLKYRFELETTGDAKFDQFIRVKFSEKVDSGATPQTASIRLPNGQIFTAPTTPSDLSGTSPEPVVTTDPISGVDFFAGEVDDPFTFDIPGFSRFVQSVLDGTPDPTQLERGRDTFAGYNTLAIVLRIPVSLLGEVANNIVGLNVKTSRNNGGGPQLDRMGTPAVNVALIPYPRKNEHNRADPRDDAKGLFADSIVETLTALGTNTDGIDLLASLAVTNGDFLRVDLGVSNTGPGGGNNPEAAFPNGRRLGDDTIDTILAIITNGDVTTGTSTGPNEQALRDVFPFFPPTHQPFLPGTLDDRTRN